MWANSIRVLSLCKCTQKSAFPWSNEIRLQFRILVYSKIEEQQFHLGFNHRSVMGKKLIQWVLFLILFTFSFFYKVFIENFTRFLKCIPQINDIKFVIPAKGDEKKDNYSLKIHDSTNISSSAMKLYFSSDVHGISIKNASMHL